MLRNYVAMPPELRRQVLARDNYTCQECGYIGCQKDYDIHVHHIIPYRLGGEHIESNLITLCSLCHNKIDKEHKLWLRGMKLPKQIRQKRVRKFEPISKTIYDEPLTKRAMTKVIKALRRNNYKTRNVNLTTPEVLAQYFEPGDIEARHKLLRIICEAAEIQPKAP